MSTKPKNKKGFFYVAFILIIILNLASGCIKMPQDLKDVIAKKFSDSADDIKKQSVLTVKETEKNITDIAQKHFAAQSVDVYKQLAEMKKEISLIEKKASQNTKTLSAISDEYKKNHINAEYAIKMAKKSLKEKDIQLAMIYALNAINHESSNINYLKFHNDLLSKNSNLSISDIDQFIAVLDLAVFQINATDVSSVIEMKTNLLAKRASIVNNITEEKNAEIAKEVGANIAELRNGRLSIRNIYINGNVNELLLKERLDTLTSLLSDTSISEKDRNSFSEDLSYSTGLYSIITTLKAVQNTLVKADSLANKQQLSSNEILVARNQLQTGNTLLAQIWTSDCSQYKEAVKTAQELQAKISEIDKKLNIIASAPARKKIEEIIDDCRDIFNTDSYNYTYRINMLTKKSKELQQLFIAIYDVDLQKTLISKAECISTMNISLSKERYKAYQEWAINKLEAARKKYYEDYNVVTDKRAMQMFDDYILEINPAILLPDVNSFYNSIYQLIYTQLPDKEKPKKQYQKAASTKIKQLEDF